MKWLYLLFVSIFSLTTPTWGQYEGLNPRSWFPLELGNYWHYDNSLSGEVPNTVWIVTSERDSLIESQKWVFYRQIFCQGPNCPRERWYSITDNNYLLRAANRFGRIDTLYATEPNSIFEATQAVDTTFQDPSGMELVVTISERDFGNPADSTHLELRYDLGIVEDIFQYNIGRAVDLVGALVNGLEVGDPSLIATVLNSDLHPPISAPMVKIKGYPNPSPNNITFTLTPQHTGLYEARVLDVLGRVLQTTKLHLIEGRTERHMWGSRAQMLPSGPYLFQVYGVNGGVVAYPFFIAK